MTRLALSFVAAATALITIPAQASDSRLVSRLYNEDEVVRIAGRIGVQASIAFAEDEHIENVAVGDSALWQITPNKRANLLFVKPLAANARTNMTVVTDRHTYFFDLVAASTGNPLYVLRFTYPEMPKHAEAPAAPPAMTAEEQRVANGEDKPVDPAQLNFAWVKRGDAKLFPDRLFDDGQATYVSWAPSVRLPAILVRNEKGDEGPVNYAVRGDTIVIDGVPERIYLRSGKDSAQLDYRATLRPAPAPAMVQAEATLPAQPVSGVR